MCWNHLSSGSSEGDFRGPSRSRSWFDWLMRKQSSSGLTPCPKSLHRIRAPGFQGGGGGVFWAFSSFVTWVLRVPCSLPQCGTHPKKLLETEPIQQGQLESACGSEGSQSQEESSRVNFNMFRNRGLCSKQPPSPLLGLSSAAPSQGDSHCVLPSYSVAGLQWCSAASVRDPPGGFARLCPLPSLRETPARTGFPHKISVHTSGAHDRDTVTGPRNACNYLWPFLLLY